MRKNVTRLIAFSAGILAAAIISWLVLTAKAATWDPNKAATYLDHREAAWASWPSAARDRKTFCVSCHTALPYALVRPILSASIGQSGPPPAETALLADVTKRVRDWNQISPYYPGMNDQSRGTEAVLNALILARQDEQRRQISADTLLAFSHMWETQETAGPDKGAWPWIQFGNEPWEAPDSAFYGACLAAVAVGIAPADYRSDPAIRPNLDLLRDYFARASAAQPPMNRAALLWASANLPGLITTAEQKKLIAELLGKQQSDGGWSVSSLAGKWERDDETPLVYKSDGYATGLVVLSLEELGFPKTDPHVAKGLSWLASNEVWWSGAWNGYSLNRRRHDPFSMVSQFMNDSATAFAVMALSQPNSERTMASGTTRPSSP